MKKINYRLVFNRKKQLNRDGKALIQVEAYLDKKKVYFSTHLYIYPRQWDMRHRQIVSHPQAEDLNRMLDEFMLELQAKELECWKRRKPISLSLLKNEMETGKSDNLGFLSFSRKWVELSMRKESTKSNMYTTLDLLQAFRPTLDFQDLTYNFLIEFENYMTRRNYETNTIAKHMKHLRTIINEAIRQGYIPHDAYPFLNYRIKTVKGKHVFLLPSEIKLLEKLTLPERYRHLQHTLDAFLFCCYSGLRYSDFIRLTSHNFILIDGRQWLRFRSQKTGVEISIPIYLLFHGKALRILHKYAPDLASFFCLPPNSTVNKELEKLRRLMLMEKHFSFHTARHTHATLLIYKGVQITTIQKLLGHRSVKTTEVYSEILSGTIVRDLQQCKV